jgi:hypothetical protein
MPTFSLYPSTTPTFDPTQQNITANSTPAVLPLKPVVAPAPAGYVAPVQTITQTPAPVRPGSVASIQAPQPAVQTPEQQLSGLQAQLASLQAQQAALGGAQTAPVSPTPGSVNGIVSGLGYNPQDQAYLDQIDAQNKANSLAVYDPQKAYKDALAMQQTRIDSINSMYNDQLNASRIRNAPGYQANLDQSRLQQGLGGYASSAAGTAQTQATQTSNENTQAQYDAQINAQRAQDLSKVFDSVDTAVTNAQNKFDSLKQSSTADYVAALKNKPAVKTQLVATAIKSLLASKLDLNTMSPEEIKTLTDKLGVTPEVLRAEFNVQDSAIKAEQAKAEQEQRKALLEEEKTKAQIENLKGEEKQKALDRALEQKKIDVQWYNAATSRISAEKTASGASDPNSKNYDSKTIPSDVKGSLYDDIVKNANASRKERKTLNDFIAAYPEVNTDYLTQIFEANQ